MRRYLILALIFCSCGLTTGVSRPLMANGPAETMVAAEQVISELMAIPGKQIPQKLLQDAQGIAIIPNVIKIGFIAGARRGHGVVLVRDHDGEWSLPQFLTLTGGSVGWQAGIQGTDVVLVFTTRKGVDGLLQGKFTVGVDASASAGPVGREAAAGTDATLRSEILSYSRSRGLFVGVSLDGSALEIDHDAHAFYYGTPSGTLPKRVPNEANDLRQLMTDLTPPPIVVAPGAPAATPVVPTEEPAPATVSPRLIESLRRSLVRNSDQLQAILSPEWRPYLAIPKELRESGVYPSQDSLSTAIAHFTKISSSPEYRRLTVRPEFQNTFEQLREYAQAVSTTQPLLELPPPPVSTRKPID
ncbi:lipid-binding SYLF domain-containing protein [Schlesneria sp. DSM 10557]|uniref:lipid-binding SYLF domain-containing protein n=1 Tax=Schlesneria sp. DSM 10557 TaxID=3044399 RepID=UPI0035A109F1